MDNKELLDMLDDLNIDECEFDNINVELNDLEKKRIKKTYRKAIKNKSFGFKKIAMVAGLSIMVCTGAFYASPVKASNIPVLSNIYEILGVYNEYTDYSQYVGISQEVQGGKYTIEEMLVTPYRSLIAIRITGNEPLKENAFNNFIVSSSIGDAHFESATSSAHKIDDYNMVQIIEAKYNSRIPEKTTVNIAIHEMETPESGASFGHANFSFKVDFGKSYDKFDKLSIRNTKLNDYKLKFKEINSSVLGTEVLGTIRSFSGESLEKLTSVNDLFYTLNVDGKMYGGLNSGSLSSLGNIVLGESSTFFKGIAIDEFQKANNISLSVFNPKYNIDELLEIYETDSYKTLQLKNESEENKVTKDGISYFKTLYYHNGSTGEFYNSKRDGETIKLYYKGNPNDITNLTNIIATSKDGLVVHYPEVYPNPSKLNEYILEFSNIQENTDISIINNTNYVNDYTLIDEFKIK